MDNDPGRVRGQYAPAPGAGDNYRTDSMKPDAAIIVIATVILMLGLIAAAGCTGAQPSDGQSPDRKELVVFAAASITGALTDIAQEYEAAHPDTKIVLNFDNSQALCTQIDHGARADLFLSASPTQMTALQGKGAIDNDTVRIVAKNQLALIVPDANAAGIYGVSDLARPGIRLVLGTGTAPFGDYTRQVIAKMADDEAYGPEFRDAVMANVISEEPTVPSLVAKLRLGEADAGIAYVSDVSAGDRDALTTIPLPEQYAVIATYPLGILTGSRSREQALAFAEYIVSPEGTAVLARYGFAPAPGGTL